MNKRIILSALLITTIISVTACKKDDATVYFATEAQQSTVADSGAEGAADSDDATGNRKSAADNSAGSGVGADTNAADSGNTQEICVYICGQIASPGVYRMNPGTRIYDLVEKAGGMLDGASENYWNLAEQLYDGQMIYIPTEEEIKSDLIPEQTSASAGSSAKDSNGRININTATKEEFMTLTGIGESKAQSIVDYRTDNGSFSKIEDITKVSGIGDAMFKKIKDDITVN